MMTKIHHLFRMKFYLLWSAVLVMVFLASTSLAREYGPSPELRFLTSPNGQYNASAAPYTGQPTNVHYRIASSDGSNRVYFDTHAQYKTPNDVKAGIFSPDSRLFAAAYHYGHQGNYTWIGIWDVHSGSLVRSETRQGWVRDISRVFNRAVPAPAPNPPRAGPPGTLPDLIIANVTWSPNSFVVQPGTTVRFHFQIQNIGGGRANGFVRVVGPGNYSGGFSGGLEAGKTKVATIDYPVHGSGTTHRMTFTVDGENTIAESNEHNNNSRQIAIQTSY